MRILHILSSNSFSGAENMVCEMIAMTEKDEEHQAFYSSMDGPIRNVLQKRDVRAIFFEKMNIVQIKRVIRIVRPNVIHAHDMKASLFAALACGRIPLISHIHNNLTVSQHLTVKSIGYLLAACKAKTIFWVSREARDDYFFHHFVKNKSKVLENILRVNALYEKAEEDKASYAYDVVFIGRMTAVKAPERALRVFLKIYEKHPEFRFAFVGDGELLNDIQKLRNTLCKDTKMDFLGFMENPLKLLREAKVMLMTSVSEGMPITALEAMAFGVPIVSTSVGGMCDLIEDDVTGFLCETDEMLVEKVTFLMENEAVRKKMSLGARKASETRNDEARYRKILFDAYFTNKKQGINIDKKR